MGFAVTPRPPDLNLSGRSLRVNLWGLTIASHASLWWEREASRAGFGGEWFDPQTRLEGTKWQLLRDAMKRHY
jgi:hypothetical protein